MKLILFSGNHNRHFFVHKLLAEKFDIAGIVIMLREKEIPVANDNLPVHDKDLFNLHFQKRYEIEKSAYGNSTSDPYKDISPTISVTQSNLNSNIVLEFVTKCNADICFIFGTDIIKEPILSALPYWKLNLHLGLSPWYRGSATLFWPFYFLQPQFSGSTLHQIIPEADAGEIVHQTVPELELNKGIHDVSVDVVKSSVIDLIRLLQLFELNGSLPLHKQKSSGRLFLTNDFEAHHLRIIYDLFDDKIVNEWLKGNLGNKVPRIANGLETR